MRRRTTDDGRRGVSGLILVILMILFVIQPSAAQQESALVNGGFEGAYVEWSQRVIVAQGWTPIHWDREPMIGGGSSGASAQPEYKPLPADVDPYRVRSGEGAQCWFWFYTHGDAAIWQRVEVPAGWWQVEAWAQAWVSSTDSAPHTSPGEMYVSIGIDPEGRGPGGWPWETSVVWSPFQLVRGDYARVQSRPVYVGQDGPIVVYLRAWKKWDEKHGDVYWDDARLFEVSGPGQVQPTATPRPTWTPAPTWTPQPTPDCPEVPSCPPCVSLDWEQMEALIERKLAEREPVRWPR